jgi:hypothetical protein
MFALSAISARVAHDKRYAMRRAFRDLAGTFADWFWEPVPIIVTYLSRNRGYSCFLPKRLRADSFRLGLANDPDAAANIPKTWQRATVPGLGFPVSARKESNYSCRGESSALATGSSSVIVDARE